MKKKIIVVMAAEYRKNTLKSNKVYAVCRSKKKAMDVLDMLKFYHTLAGNEVIKLPFEEERLSIMAEGCLLDYSIEFHKCI